MAQDTEGQDTKGQDTGGQETGGQGNEDIKAKMREALDRKQSNRGVPQDGPVKEKAHGSEVTGGAGPKMHRRKAGGGGS